jgi:phenylacetate-CoA ligase
MDFLPVMRRWEFFARDALRGGPVASQVREIESIVANPESVESQARRDLHLQNLLNHAVRTVPFYQRLAVTADALAHFPVMSKRTYQEQPEQMQSRSFDISALPHAETSGSSGTPLRVPRDPVKRQRHIADLISFIRLAGYDFGDPVVFLANSSTPRRRMQAVQKVDARVYEEALVHRFHAAINDYTSVRLMGAPSVLEFVGRHLSDAGTSLPPGKVKSVLTVSESMTPWLQAHSHEVYGQPAVSRYSSWETGILAQQTVDSQGQYIVNHASYLVELLALDSDAPVAPGELGRIVVTDLFAHAMPLIRYDTGDLGSWSVDNPLRLQKVVGRRVDVLIAEDGRLVAPYVVTGKLLEFPGIRQFQLAQTGPLTHRLSLIAEEDPSRDEAIGCMLREVLGPGIRVTVEYVDSVEVLPSGKRRPVTNLWIQAGDDSHTHQDLGDVS